VVTGIDWGKTKDRIVTCSHDRNAYVWNFKDGSWVPTLVILRINRGATACKWSPNEDKFAVASGSKVVSICYFEQENDWWVSKHIKNHKSTVTSVAWHPSNIYIATGSTDFKARIFSAFVKGLDKMPSNPPFGDARPVFGKPVQEYATGGWVHDVGFSPNGNVLGFISHDSTVNFVDIASNQHQRIPSDMLPFRSCQFANDGAFVAAGYDCNPMLFQGSGANWKLAKSLDQATGEKKADLSATGQARARFVNMTDKGQTDITETTLTTKHQNAISCVSPVQGGSFTTTAVDGKIITWKI